MSASIPILTAPDSTVCLAADQQRDQPSYWALLAELCPTVLEDLRFFRNKLPDHLLQDNPAPTNQQLTELMPDWWPDQSTRNFAKGYPIYHRMGDFLTAQSGKFFRATLTLTTAHAVGVPSRKALSLATAIELLHLASLLHDDVVDGSALRRGVASVPSRFGNSASVLMGDRLLTRAYQLTNHYANHQLNTVCSEAVAGLCQGELEQLDCLSNLEMTEADYFRLIQFKTGSLMGYCCQGPVILTQDQQGLKQWHHFGYLLGVLFQMTDDLLDYQGNPEKVGKPVGQDLKEGKVTLPLLLLRQRLGNNRPLDQIFEQHTPLEEVVELMNSHGVFAEINQRIEDLSQTCLTALEQAMSVTGETPAADCLRAMVDFVALRYH